MTPRALALLLTCVLSSGAGDSLSSHGPSEADRGDLIWIEETSLDPGGLPPPELLHWDHWGLRLYLWDLDETGDRTRVRFCLQLKPGVERAWTSVGYPRYRIASGRWHEAASEGLPGSRVLTASLESQPRQFFSVIVSRDVDALRLAVGDRSVQIDLAEWAGLRSEPGRTEIVDAWSPPATATELGTEAAPGSPARLTAHLRWEGSKPFGDGVLEAGETGVLLVDVVNDGEREARGVRIEISPAEIPHLTFPRELPVEPIAPGGTAIVRVPVSAGAGLEDSRIRMTFDVLEPFGHDASPLGLELNTRRAPRPELILTSDFAVGGSGIPVPRDTIATVRLRVRNVGLGAARAAVAEVDTGENVFPAHDTQRRFQLGDLGPGEIAEFSFRCYANQRADQLSLQVDLRHERMQTGPVRSLVTLPLEDGVREPRIVRIRPDPTEVVPLSPPPAPLTSEIDRIVPRTVLARPTGLAVVLGVEDYPTAPPATYSAEDARTAARYFQHALGIPAERIQLLIDREVTLGRLHRIFGRDGWLARRVQAESEIFVFYAGHGVAARDAFEPYLVPADGDMNYVQQTGYPLDLMIERLAELDARSTTLFLDACFSGLTRDGQALIDGARPLVLDPVRRRPSGLSLFSAARGTQIASSLDTEGHGLFSFLLFTGLAGAADGDGDGRIAAGELKRFLEAEVPSAAARLDREQNPTVFLADEDHLLVRLP